MAFVVAALIAAVLLAERLGQPAEMQRRYYQVGLAFMLTLLITGVSVLAFTAPESAGFSGPRPEEETDEIVKALRERQVFSVACASLLLIVGIFAASRWRTLYLPVALGAILVLTSQAFDSGQSQILPYLYDFSGEAGTVRNLLYVVALAAGSIVLLIYGYSKWERLETSATLPE